MIVETIIAGLTVVFISSLMFANAQIKRQRRMEVEDLERERKWEAEDNAPPPEPEPEPTIYPFVEMRVGIPCPKCLVPVKEAVMGEDEYGEEEVVESAQGPQLPRACPYSTCKAAKYPHLHAYCNTCEMDWFMAPADHKEKKDDNRQPHPPGTEQSHQV